MPSVNHHQTSVKKTAYYSTLGEANAKVKYLWIVCHGYGQLSSQIIHKFSSIATEEHFFIAPEGLSRFYWNEAKGQVGSSWMTKQDRLHEIADYSNYLQGLVDQYLPLCQADTKVVAFGFSQGVATVWRWMMDKRPSLHSLIMWAGMTPEDLDYLQAKNYLSTIAFSAIYGTQDQYLSEERVRFQMNLEIEQQLDIKHFTFDGNHIIDRSVLKELLPSLV
jgi:predicted esterase